MRTEYEKSTKTGYVSDACQRYGVGRRALMATACEAKAVIKLGKRYLINYDRMDQFLNDKSR